MAGTRKSRYPVIYVIEPEYLEKADEMLEDKDYQKKVNELMSIMQGKRIVGKQSLGSIINQGDCQYGT